MAADVINTNAELLKATFFKHYRRVDDAIGRFRCESALAALRRAVSALMEV